MATAALKAQLRRETGKGAARSLRRRGLIPAVFYGPEVEPTPLAIKPRDLQRLLATGAGENILFDLIVEGNGDRQGRPAMIKEIQEDPVKNIVLHVDICAIAMDKKITLEVPVTLKGTPAGVEDGGILQQVRRSLSIFCLPGRIPDSLEVDVTGLEIGDSLHVSDLEVPAGVEVLEEEGFTVATVVPPTRVEEEIETLEEGEEVEEAASETEEFGE